MDRKKAAKALKNGVGILLLAALVFAACRVAAGRRPRVKVYEVKTSGVVFDAAEGDFSDAGGSVAGGSGTAAGRGGGEDSFGVNTARGDAVYIVVEEGLE